MMKKTIFAMSVIGLVAASAAMADGVLTGDKRLACEAILCLSTGNHPSECQPSLDRYFSIKKSHMGDEIQARLDFLHKCPASDQTKDMSDLVNAIANGAGRCDAKSLNTETLTFGNDEGGTVVIGNTMPDYCTNYVNNQYTRLGNQLPMYVGQPDKGGFWADPGDYQSALAKYNEQQSSVDNSR